MELIDSKSRSHLQKTFVSDVHKASIDELYEAKFTFLNWKSVSELWALNVIKREIASREQK